MAKTVTVVIAVLVIIGGAMASSKGRREGQRGDIKVTHLNELYEEMEDIMKHSVLTKDELKQDAKTRKAEEKAKEKEEKARKEPVVKKRIFVIKFEGDVKAEGVDSLAQEITTILTLATSNDEIFVHVESPGGQVHGYGLAAAQLSRIRDRGIPLTISVDKVAASGGYMMACIANKIIAAPFAIVGSIGVVAELPNFNRLIRKMDVDYDVYTAGQFKRTVTVLGENTEEGKKKFVEEIEETHQLFKALVSSNRPQLDMDVIATGEHWYGTQAIELKLVDELCTSDDYLYTASKDADLFEVKYEIKRSMADKLGFAMEGTLNRVLTKWWGELNARGKNVI